VVAELPAQKRDQTEGRSWLTNNGWLWPERRRAPKPAGIQRAPLGARARSGERQNGTDASPLKESRAPR